MFLRSLVNLTQVDTGFEKDHVIRAGVDPAAAGYRVDARLEAMMQQVEERVGALPGFAGASFAFYVFEGYAWSNDVTVPGRPKSEKDPDVAHDIVGPGYFSAMNMPILYGRGLEVSDNRVGKRVAVINETMAEVYFPGQPALGRTFKVESDWGDAADWRSIEVVGVVKNAKYTNLQERPTPAAFYPWAQHRGLFLYAFIARHSGDSRTAAAAIRNAVAEVDPNLPMDDFTSLAQVVDDSVLRQRLVAQVSVFFGILAAFLACIGLYGVLSHAVARRTNEFGIRMAIGAERGNVLRMVLGEAGRLVLAGVAIGFVLALAGGRLIGSFLFGVSAYDPVSLTLAVALLLAVALFAAYLPARRATRIDPMIALRYE